MKSVSWKVVLLTSLFIQSSVSICNLGLFNLGCFNIGFGNTGAFNVGLFNKGAGNVGFVQAGRKNVGLLNLGYKQRGLGNIGLIPRIAIFSYKNTMYGTSVGSCSVFPSNHSGDQLHDIA